jgi:hypothetical protein
MRADLPHSRMADEGGSGPGIVMPGLVPGIHVFSASRKTWMVGT